MTFFSTQPEIMRLFYRFNFRKKISFYLCLSIIVMKFDGKLVVLLFLCFIAIAVVVVKSPSYNDTTEGFRSDSDPLLEQIRFNFSLLNPDYQKVPLKIGNSSYTENKEVIYLCLRHPKSGEEYNLNIMMYVALHELAHYISKSYGHNEEWKKNFQKLLDDATKLGIYDPNEIIPVDYCGIKSVNK